MAPEQIDTRTFGPISPATDIYAVGIMLYQLLSGTLPFTGTLTEVFHGHINVEPVWLDRICAFPVPEPLMKILKRALAKRPSDRFTSAREFRDALEKASDAVAGDAITASRAVSAKTLADSSKTLAINQSGGAAEGLAKGGTLLVAGDTRGTQRRSANPVVWVLAAAVALVLMAVGLYFGLVRDSAKTAQASDSGTQQVVQDGTVTPSSPTSQDAVAPYPEQPLTNASAGPAPIPESPINTAVGISGATEPTSSTPASTPSAMEELLRRRAAAEVTTPVSAKPAPSTTASASPDTGSQEPKAQTQKPQTASGAASRQTQTPTADASQAPAKKTSGEPTIDDWVVTKKEVKKIE
jgi:serine/threonine-protein kinase